MPDHAQGDGLGRPLMPNASSSGAGSRPLTGAREIWRRHKKREVDYRRRVRRFISVLVPQQERTLHQPRRAYRQ